MTSEKQIAANQLNAQLSTGAITDEGKAIVSKNAVKHGIFTKDLIVDAGGCKENPEEFNELRNSLIQDLQPNGEMQALLVEKIAVDFWRMKRVLRFENAQTQKHYNEMIEKYYEPFHFDLSKNVPTERQIADELIIVNECIEWNNDYIQSLESKEINFDNEKWYNEKIEVNLHEELTEMLDVCELLPNYSTSLTFDKIKQILKENDIANDDIIDFLLKHAKENQAKYANKISDLENQRSINKNTEEITAKICSIPVYPELAMRYERSLQKSIFQNLIMLKKLQGVE